jgi:predicted Zn-dependent protease
MSIRFARWPVTLALFLGFALLAPRARASVMQSEITGAHYKANIAASPDLNRARTHIGRGDLDGALAALRSAVGKDSLSGEVYDEIGQLQLRRGEYRRAYTSFQQAAELAPAEAPVWNRLAQVAMLQLGFEQEGLLALRYGQVADSTFSPLFYTQFVYHWARCEFADAADAIAQARKHESEEGRALLWYSAQLSFEMTEGDFAKTANALRIHLVQADNDYSARIALVQAERGMDKPVDARNDAYGLLALDPNQPSWLIEAGLAQRALGRRDSALVFFDRAVRSDTSSYEALYDRTLTRLAIGDTASAFGEMHRLRRIDPGNWLTPLLASRVARAHGDTLRAHLAFDEARRLNPALGLASAMRAGAAAAVPGWSSPELETAEKLIENGEFSLAGNQLYLAARDKDRRAAALYWLSRVTRISGAPAGLPVIAAQAGAEASSGDPIFIRLLAESQAAAGDTARARANLRGLRKGAPGDLIGAALLAEADLKAGGVAEARAVFAETGVEPTRSYRFEAARAAVLAAAHDAGAAIARQRAAAADYLAR